MLFLSNITFLVTTVLETDVTEEKTYNRPNLKEVSVKQCIHYFEHHNTCEMTHFTIIIPAIRSNDI